MSETEFVKASIVAIDPVVKIFNINNIALFTTDPLIKGVNQFEVCNSLRSVAEFFGTNTDTYKIANAMFSQSRKFTDGDGSLYIIPFGGENATSTTIITDNLTSKINAFKTINDGKIKFTIDGIIHDINGLNFNNIASISDIVKIIQKKISESILSIEVAENQKIKFLSLKVGSASTLVIEESALSGTSLIDETLFDEDNFVKTTGVNSSGETLQEACQRILALPEGERPSFESLITNLRFAIEYTDNSVFKNFATYLNGQDKIFTYTYSSVHDNANALAIQQASLKKIRLLAHKPSEALEITGAVASFLFSNKLGIANNSLTLNKKKFAGITPVLYWSDGEKQAFQNAGVDYYINNKGTPAYWSSVANGGAYDDIYNEKFITLEVVQAVDNGLNSPTKLPQTQASVDFIALSIISPVLTLCRNNGIIPIDSGVKWNSSQKPSNISDAIFQDIISREGFYIEIPNIADQPQVDREQRKMPIPTIYIKLAGAIHRIDIVGYLEK